MKGRKEYEEEEGVGKLRKGRISVDGRVRRRKRHPNFKKKIFSEYLLVPMGAQKSRPKNNPRAIKMGKRNRSKVNPRRIIDRFWEKTAGRAI